jgi:hypothetical protein
MTAILFGNSTCVDVDAEKNIADDGDNFDRRKHEVCFDVGADAKKVEGPYKSQHRYCQLDTERTMITNEKIVTNRDGLVPP